MAKQHSGGLWYCGAYMPFGGSSCPSIFSGYSLATKWIIARYTSLNMEDIFNMLDDNLFLSAPGPRTEKDAVVPVQLMGTEARLEADEQPDLFGKQLMESKEREADRVILSLGWRLNLLEGIAGLTIFEGTLETPFAPARVLFGKNQIFQFIRFGKGGCSSLILWLI